MSVPSIQPADVDFALAIEAWADCDREWARTYLVSIVGRRIEYGLDALNAEVVILAISEGEYVTNADGHRRVIATEDAEHLVNSAMIVGHWRPATNGGHIGETPVYRAIQSVIDDAIVVHGTPTAEQIADLGLSRLTSVCDGSTEPVLRRGRFEREVEPGE